MSTDYNLVKLHLETMRNQHKLSKMTIDQFRDEFIKDTKKALCDLIDVELKNKKGTAKFKSLFAKFLINKVYPNFVITSVAAAVIVPVKEHSLHQKYHMHCASAFGYPENTIKLTVIEKDMITDRPARMLSFKILGDYNKQRYGSL